MIFYAACPVWAVLLCGMQARIGHADLCHREKITDQDEQAEEIDNMQENMAK